MSDHNIHAPLETFQALVSTFLDFLTVAIHTILYEREIYPQSTFLSSRKYNCAVRQNRHPKVCKWIMDAVAAVEVEMLKGTVARTVLLIYSPESQPLERFLFDTSRFPSILSSEALTEFEDHAEDEGGLQGRMKPISPVDVEEQFRSVMRKLSSCQTSLGKLPTGCSFTVCIELKKEADPPIGVSQLLFCVENTDDDQNPQPWIPSQPSLQYHARGKDQPRQSDLGGTRTIPLRTVEAGEFILECWIEEGKFKTQQSHHTKNDMTSSE